MIFICISYNKKTSYSPPRTKISEQSSLVEHKELYREKARAFVSSTQILYRRMKQNCLFCPKTQKKQTLLYSFFNSVTFHLYPMYIYIYIYICVCVCVCVWKEGGCWFWSCKEWYTRIIKWVSRLFSYGHFYWEYTHETQLPFEVISSGCNALVPFQQLLQGPIEVLLCERVNDLRHSLFYLLSCLITTASELRE